MEQPTDQPALTLDTVDGEVLTLEKARKQVIRSFYAGFFCLPLLWFINVWLFWPDFVGGRDPVVRKYTRRSAVCFVVSSLLFLPWFIFYLAGGKKFLSHTVYDRLDVVGWGVTDYIGL